VIPGLAGFFRIERCVRCGALEARMERKEERFEIELLLAEKVCRRGREGSAEISSTELLSRIILFRETNASKPDNSEIYGD